MAAETTELTETTEIAAAATAVTDAPVTTTSPFRTAPANTGWKRDGATKGTAADTLTRRNRLGTETLLLPTSFFTLVIY